MRYAVISDVHANAMALTLVLESILEACVDRILCLGDIVGFHTYPGECIDLLRSHGVTCIAGNHDDGVRGKLGPRFFSKEIWESIEWTRNQLNAEQMDFLCGLPAQQLLDDRIWTMHGTSGSSRRYLVGRFRLMSVACRMKNAGIRVAFHGHTHRPTGYRMSGTVFPSHVDVIDTSQPLSLLDTSCYIVNPGSVGQPRTKHTEATFNLFDTETGLLTWRKVAYDYAKVVKETLTTFPTHHHLYERFRGMS